MADTSTLVSTAIAKQSGKIPADTFFWAGLGSVGASIVLKLAHKNRAANFFAQWAPTLLIFGAYNKFVKGRVESAL